MEPYDMEKKKAVLKIHSEIRRALSDALRKEDFIEISPVILSPITDPLNHPTAPAIIRCYGNNYNVTQSMIFHKQLALRTLDKIFVFSPNVRLEQQQKQSTGRHLFEFTQLDVEVKNAHRDDILRLCETLLVSTLASIKTKCAHELRILGRTMSIPKTPFDTIQYKVAFEQYGGEIEMMISTSHHAPVWLLDIPLQQREFYDREDPSNPGYLKDMDLIYPDGYGEALSGGEREHDYERIIQRIQRKGQSLTMFTQYLNLARQNLPASAGFGIGIERLTRYVCGLQRIEETSLFPKIPGNYCI
jgi:asparaginyl-tRNA synthetase